MNYDFEENDLVEPEIEENKKEISWRKAFSWVALAFCCIIPIVSIGLGVMCISSATDEEKDEVSLICYIALAIAGLLIFNNMVVVRVMS